MSREDIRTRASIPNVRPVRLVRLTPPPPIARHLQSGTVSPRLDETIFITFFRISICLGSTSPYYSPWKLIAQYYWSSLNQIQHTSAPHHKVYMMLKFQNYLIKSFKMATIKLHFRALSLNSQNNTQMIIFLYQLKVCLQW